MVLVVVRVEPTYPRNVVPGPGVARTCAPDVTTVSSFSLYASLIRVSRKSGWLNDRRRVTHQGDMCAAKAFSKVSDKCQVSPEVRLLASVISPADTIPH